MAHAGKTVALSDNELAFFRLSCDLFPTPESPLRFLDEEDREPDDVEAVFSALSSRGLLNSTGAGASTDLADRLRAVSECHARVRATVRTGTRATTRDFYLTDETVVEYHRDERALHVLGPPRAEGSLAAELARTLHAAESTRLAPLRMSASDYLVFAVFARDVRATPNADESANASMSIDEVLSYFDEPEARVVRTPNDDTWQASVESLAASGVLVPRADGYALHSDLHALAREVVADHQYSIVRFDFLDEQWLVREVNLYPAAEAVYRLGSEPDGSVAIEELSADVLVDVIAEIVTSLPNLINPDVQSTLESSRG